jgi:hypothetical protein
MFKASIFWKKNLKGQIIAISGSYGNLMSEREYRTVEEYFHTSLQKLLVLLEGEFFENRQKVLKVSWSSFNWERFYSNARKQPFPWKAGQRINGRSCQIPTTTCKQGEKVRTAPFKDQIRRKTTRPFSLQTLQKVEKGPSLLMPFTSQDTVCKMKL